MAKNWNPDLHLRDNRGRLHIAGAARRGHEGGRLTQRQPGVPKAYVDPEVKDKPPEEAVAYYEWNVSERHQIYEENKTLLDKNLFTTGQAQPNTVVFPRDERHPDKSQFPRHSICGRKYFLMMGRPTREARKEPRRVRVAGRKFKPVFTTDTKKWRGGAKVIDTAKHQTGNGHRQLRTIKVYIAS